MGKTERVSNCEAKTDEKKPRHFGLHTWILQNSTMLRRQQRSLDRPVLLLEIVAYILHLHPLDAIVSIDVFDQSVAWALDVSRSSSTPRRELIVSPTSPT